MTSKQIFETYLIQSIGSLQQISDNAPYYEVVYSDVLKKDIEGFIDYFKASRMFHISEDFNWDIVPIMDINALCFRVGDQENIGLYYGLIALVYHFYGVLFCSSKFLPHIQSQELVSAQTASFHTITDKELEQHFNEMTRFREHFTIEQHKIPNDSARFEKMNEYGLYSCLFVFLHEIGHLVRGHLDSDTSRLAMIDIAYNNKHLTIHDIQAIYLELDADKFASYMYTKFFLETHTYFDLEPKVHFYHKWLPILLYFILVDVRTGVTQSSLYPKPAYRYALIKKSILNHFKTKTELNVLKIAIDKTERTITLFFEMCQINNFSFFEDLKHKDAIHSLEINYKEAVDTINRQFNDRHTNKQ